MWQDVLISSSPKFCNHCRVVEHVVTDCNKIRVELGSEKQPIATKKQCLQSNGEATEANVNKNVWNQDLRTIGADNKVLRLKMRTVVQLAEEKKCIWGPNS